MRKLVINHLLEPPNRVTGITRFLFSLTAGLLRNAQFDIVLATTWDKASLPAPLHHPRLEVETLPFEPKAIVNVFRQNRLLPELMRRHGADAEFNANPIGGFSGNWMRIITLHDLYYRLMPEAYPFRHRAIWRGLFPLSVQHADAILVPSDSTRQDLATYYRNAARKAFVVHEAPAMTGPFEPRSPLITGRHGIMVGNLSPNKNAAVIVDAIARLAERGVRVPLLHVGRDELGILAAAQSKTSSAVEIVSVAGIDDATLHAAFTHAAFFINASLHEGFCLPLVEAQECGTPVIVSNCSALPEVAGDGALLVDPRSPDDIARAIHMVWTNPDVAANLRRRAVANAARFSWDKAALELIAKFESLKKGKDAKAREPHPQDPLHAGA